VRVTEQLGPIVSSIGQIAEVLASSDTRAGEALWASEALFRAIFDRTPIGIGVTDLTGRYLQANPALLSMLGRSAGELSCLTFRDVTHPDDVETDWRFFLELIAGEREQYHIDKRYVRGDGTTVWGRLMVALIRDSQGLPLLEIGLVEDITDRKRVEESLREAEARHRTLVEQLPVAAYMGPLDATASTSYISREVEQMLGYSRQDWIDDPDLWRKLLHPEDRDRVMAEHRRHMRTRERFVSEYRMVRSDGRIVWVRDEAVVVAEEQGAFQHGVFIDITKRRRAELALEHQALHDALTGLPNRALLNDRLLQTLRSTRREPGRFALLLMDLDRFKEINDTFGHHWGDLVLRDVAGRLRGVLRQSDTVARLGGDEFAILLPKADAAGAGLTARKIQKAMSQPFCIEGQLLDIGTSIGIALYPDHGSDAGGLLRHADVAMYIAKRADIGHAIYTPDQDEYSPARLSLIGELRRDIRAGCLTLHYQPKVSLATGRVDSVEALVRWQHPERGLVSPAQFISLAEHTGLIRPLTQWVLRAALEQCRAWRDDGLSLGVAINLSARNLHDARLPAAVARLLNGLDLDPSLLRLEVTESAVMTDPARATRILSRLHGMGVHIAIDDFGTGHSSLGYLKRLPVDEIKIDKSFVLDMTADADDAFIVRSVIDLGHHLGLTVVAEGVESAEALDRLAELGCDLAQGYVLARPMPAESLLGWLQEAQGGQISV
jgi:diguanylate cyclase (GGDEF)-like protein/PAS domain S-box-containing protein